MDVLLPVLGVSIMLFVLLDVFLTVLYARIGTGIISHHLACWVWQLFRWGSKPFGRARDRIVTFAGPSVLVLLVLIWISGLIFGAAMIIKPQLGKSIQASSGTTPTDFTTAVYIAGDSMTTVGVSDLAPKTSFFRMLVLINSFIGISVITLTLTYFLEVYNSLQRRNTFAVKLHMLTTGTGDSADLVAGLGPNGRFDVGYAHLVELGAEMVSFSESHHFYSVLLYFRFREPHYAISRIALVAVESVTLIKSALDDQEYGWLKESAAVTQLWKSTMHMLTVLADAFLPRGIDEPEIERIDQQTLARWRRRYRAACRRLRQANIKTFADEEAGAEIYISLRARWDRYVTTFAHHMAQTLQVIDPAGQNPEDAEDRAEYTARLRAVE